MENYGVEVDKDPSINILVKLDLEYWDDNLKLEFLDQDQLGVISNLYT